MKRSLILLCCFVLGAVLRLSAQQYFYDYLNPNNVGTWISGMHFINNNTGWACGTGGVIHRTTDGGATWATVNYGGKSEINDVFFVNATTGWAVGTEGTILKSTDGGITWTPQTSGVTTELADVYFASATNGWAAVGTNLGGGATTSTILRTTDGGASWIPATVPVAATSINSIDFVSATVGYAAGNARRVFKTVDGGITWTNITVPTALLPTGNHTFYAIDAIDANTVLVGGSNNSMYRTIDGGTTWTAVTGVVSSQTRDICFWSATNGVAVGNGGRVLTTTNGGVTWTSTQPIPGNDNGKSLYACSAPSGTAVYIGGQRGITLKSTDGGVSWNLGTYRDELGSSALAISFANSSTGMAGGFLGTASVLLKTTDSGVTWSSVAGVPGTAIEVVEYLDLNTVLVSNSNGTTAGIYKSVNNGTSWTNTPVTGNTSTAVSNACLDIFKVNSNLVVGCGRQGRFYKSVNGGDSWTVTSSLDYAPSFSVASTNPSTCGSADGAFTISGLEIGKSYAVKYVNNNGVAVPSANYIADANGQIVIGGLTAGRYTSVMVSLNGCTGTTTTTPTLVDPNAATFNTAVTAPTICGGADGFITLTGTGATGIVASTQYSVSYLDDGVLVGPAVFTTNASRQIIITGLNAGVYSNITVASLSGCARPATGAPLIQDPASPTFSAAAANTSS